MIENRNLKEDLKQLDTILKQQGISRRDAMKMMGLGGASFLVGSTEVEASTTSSIAKAKILIVGGGLAGISTAARLTNSLTHPDITIIEPLKKSASYQPGQTLVGSGIWKKKDVLYNRDDFVPNGATLISEKAVEFDPDNNTVTTDKGTILKYDYLVIAAGVKLNYAGIKGLEDVGELYSAGENEEAIKLLTQKGVSSIYTIDGAEQTWTNLQAFIEKAKLGQKVNALFTHPETSIKCGGAPKKIMYLANARLNEAGKDARANANLHFYPNGGTMFGIKDYHEAIVKQFEKRDMKYSYNHNLLEIKDGIAVFDDHSKFNEVYDEDLEENVKEIIHTSVEKEFDFIHVTPPMKAPDEIGNSKLGSTKGWVPVNKETMQHVKYPNVFALGDIAAVPMGKTGGSARKQYKVVVNNIISMMETGTIPTTNAKYDGYTVCPLITNIGTVMLAEFNWASKDLGSGKNASMISLLDPTKERYIWWLLKVYLLKPMTVYGMLAGKA
ncbi:MAG: FAD/NAD(P)-binding oxidoreductase [Arcobacteraceae bacterium]